MPTDKALAVMTPQHHAGIARLAGNEEVNESEGYHPYGVSAKHLRDIESVVRYLVDHPERLAGEGQVIVDREELKKSVEMLRDSPVSRYGNARLTLILAWMEGWLAGSPTAQEATDG